MPNIFYDYHHSGTFHALHLLFERRLKYSIYAPIGMDWLEKGLWKAYESKADRQLFLGTEGKQIERDGSIHWINPHEEAEQKFLTMEQFYSTPLDIVMCTHPAHEAIYHRLSVEKGAKFVRWLGNPGELFDMSKSRNIIDTTGIYRRRLPMWCNYVHIFQEFPLDVFYPEPPVGDRVIRQWLHFPRKQPHYHSWHRYQQLLPEFNWMEHGMEGADGLISPISELARVMRDSAFTWHMKHWDGFGLIAHGSIAVGRPLITRGSFWRGKTLAPLLIDGDTYIDLDKMTVAGNTERIRKYSHPDEQARMYEATVARWDAVVSYDEERQKIERFIGRLV